MRIEEESEYFTQFIDRTEFRERSIGEAIKYGSLGKQVNEKTNFEADGKIRFRMTMGIQ
jgi:hypothetical protein